MTRDTNSATERARSAYEESEKRVANSMEEIVSGQGFAEGLSLLTSNLVALSRVATIGLDQVVRATRFAGRVDVTRLGRQIGRTEDKLEQVLQVVERLEEELAEERAKRECADGTRLDEAWARRGPRSPREEGSAAAQQDGASGPVEAQR